MNPQMAEFVRLCRILVENHGQKLYRAVNSPRIIGVETHMGKLWIKLVRGRLMITLNFHKDNARTCVYDDDPQRDTVVGDWGCWLHSFRDEIQRWLVLDALAGVSVRAE